MYIKKFIGSKEFYKMVFALLIPMVIQQGITNFVNLVDNLMVGRLGTESMSGVAIINQLMFVFNITIFGCLAGAGIYGAQFYGNNDHDGVRYTFRFKIYLGMIVFVLGTFLFMAFGDNLIRLYLSDSASGVGNLELTFSEAKNYLKLILIGLFPFMLSQCYSTTLRECGETVIPMVASMVAIFVNIFLNAVLIFGYLGFPAMGVKGAAIATVIARYIETIIIVYKTHANYGKFVFIEKAFEKIYIPFDIIKKIVKTGLPLLLNEFLWSLGMATLTQSYSVRGLDVMAALNISSTVCNLFMIVMFAMGGAISVIVGQELGSGNIESAKDMDRKLIFFNVVTYVVIGSVLALLSPIIPHIYNTEEAVRHLATEFLIVYASALPLHAFIHSTYFTIRSGGKTWVTFFFDSVFVWLVSIPVAFFFTRFTAINIVLIYLIVQYIDVIKAIIGFVLLKSGMWARNIIHKEA